MRGCAHDRPGPLQPVLITGCSTGIGREAARHLAGKGHLVYATARIRTEFANAASGAIATADATGPYGSFNAAVAQATTDAYEARSPGSAAGPTPSRA